VEELLCDSSRFSGVVKNRAEEGGDKGRRRQAKEETGALLTVGEVGVAQLEVLAGARRVALRSHRMLHLLDLQLQRVERAEDLLHAVVVVFVVGVRRGAVLRHLAGVDVPPVPALHGGHDGQRVDDIAGGALPCGGGGERRRREEEERGGGKVT